MLESLDDMKMLLTYVAMSIPSIFFTVAVGVLFFRQRSVSTGLFFGGSLVTSLLHLVNTFGIFYLSRYGDIQSYQKAMMVVSVVSFFALLVQAIGLLIFALELPKKHAENL